MNIDHILRTVNEHAVDCILAGGTNFMLNHAPILTFDVDLWILDTDENRARVSQAPVALQAEWGLNEKEWKPVGGAPDWLKQQNVYCLTSPHGAIDVFRQLRGLENQYEHCRRRALARNTASGIPYVSLSDEDMLRCQETLDPADQKADRMRILREAIARRKQQP